MLTVTVLGDPVGQGNIRHLGAGRPAIHQNAKRLKPWRAAIVEATGKAMAEIGQTEPLDGPLHLEARFLMPRGKTVKRELPTVPPDIDHLLRALGDALTTARAIADDARIVSLSVTERYATGPLDPGVEFTVRPVIGGDLP